VGKNTIVVFSAPLMTTIAELGSLITGEKAAAASGRQHHARPGASADFRTGTSAPGSGELEVKQASVPPGDGGVGGQVGVAEDG
jgi:hypothetical protein